MEPQRMCLACRARDDVSALWRLAVVDGAVVVDRARRLPGRGAHVHPGCAETLAARRGVVGRALKVGIDPAQVAAALAAARRD
ncbi:MAG: DUF448 domain-containing protein [Propionibacteriales bacterium]|nr:DUF448 domain-containing protein [Propionibacteriales bacterium]